jgi:putative transposase
VANSKSNPKKPGNANLQMGAVSQENVGLQMGGEKNAILENGAPRWHSRGYLPHFERSEVIQHVTFHLADSLPQTALLQLESELKFLSPEKRTAERRKQIDAWIDACQGSCVLRKPAIAQMVQTSLLTFEIL